MSEAALRTPRRPGALLATCAGLVCVGALLLRLDAAPRGLPYLYPWDEPHYSSLAFRMAETGDLNPRFFNYPTFPTYLYALVDWVYLAVGAERGEARPGSPAWEASRNDSWNVPETRMALLNRWVTSVVGAVTCGLAMLLGLRLGVPWAGLGAGGLMALSPYLIHETAHAAVDPWMALFALLAVMPLTSVSPSRRGLVLSAVLAGVTTACKYNGVLVLVPTLWLAGRGATHPWRERAALGLLALAVFLACSPFLVLDARLAAHHVFYELRHYAVQGHEGHEYGRGLGNLAFHLGFIEDGLGPLAWLALPGAVWLAVRDGRARRAFAFPALYLAFMSLQRTAFGRNMDALFPFVALAALAPLGSLARAPRRPGPRVVSAVVASAVVVVGFFVLAQRLGRAQVVWRTPDSRTAAARFVAARVAGASGAVARELHVHGEDLQRAGGGWTLAGSDTVATLARAGLVAWALLPDSVSMAGGAVVPVEAAYGLVPAARFGERALDRGPPERPRLVVWLRGRP